MGVGEAAASKEMLAGRGKRRGANIAPHDVLVTGCLHSVYVDFA